MQCLVSHECNKEAMETQLSVGAVVRITSGMVNILPRTDTGVYILLEMEVLGMAAKFVGHPKVGGPSILKVLSPV